MDFRISQNVARMKGSATLKAMQDVLRLREQGIEVIDLTVGEPDFPSPRFICELAIEGLSKGYTKYTPSKGLKVYAEAISEFYYRRFGAQVSPSQIAASCGAKQAVFNAICSLINPGDEVLIPKPYWVSFPEIVNFCNGKVVFIETEENDFILSLESVKRAVTDKSKLLILNSPNNPTGRVTSAEEIKKIIEFCADRKIFVIADECYLFFVYPPMEVFTVATLPAELRHFVCIAGSFSKTFSMTGWRIGYSIANEEWTKGIVRLQSHSASHPTSFVQYACAKAITEKFDESMNVVNEMLDEYKKRRELLVFELQRISGFECKMPQGAFYAFVDVRALTGKNGFSSSADVASYLLEKGHVAVTDGSGFGAEGFLRFSYATSTENLKKAVEQIKSVVKW
ncbi:MAG: pyridoxal phosphate-dependent aminotransferase [Pyrinomonadaceae bacterium]|nr:pyridoxal phosphate-dependent aminotransferase [Pyrinomonadaceae bacterium]MCX7640352.1 pyridoxal phosphate-dependent aminotransferase [Pyrinomonadaceae bacterium]MDW8304780.1 pyridoxal phosphate-dependent aminotransferase [Acidobacteriota bacterium]